MKWRLPLLLLAGCSADNPQVTVDISANGAVDLSAFVRLHVVARTCDHEDLAFVTDFSPDAPPADPVVMAVPPGTPFYVWVQGWEPCADTCVMPESLAVPGDCVCFEELSPIKQRMTSEACSDWNVHTEGDLTLELAVGPRIPGTCPPEISACR